MLRTSKHRLVGTRLNHSHLSGTPFLILDRGGGACSGQAGQLASILTIGEMRNQRMWNQHTNRTPHDDHK